MGLLILFLILIGIAFCVFWCDQLLDLMARRDDEFPGRHDKLIWAAILILVPVVGAIAYSVYRSAIPPKVTFLQREWEKIQADRAREALEDTKPV